MPEVSHVKRAAYSKRLGALRSERSEFFAHWQQIAQRILPHAGRFFLGDKKGGVKFGSIYDNTATWSHGVLTAGLFGGLSSPARPFFRLIPADKDLIRSYDVAVWTEDVVERMHSVLARSNFYRVAQHVYGEVGAFGTAAVVAMEDPDTVVHFSPLTAGEYCLATDWRDQVVTMYREFQQSAGALATEFGLEALSAGTQRLAKDAPDTMVSVCHAVQPRTNRNGEFEDAQNKPWESVYFEVGGNTENVLRVSGYDRFPVFAPRWKSMPGEAYGIACPGMVALGDTRGLQHKHDRKATTLNQLTDPALIADPSLKARDVDRLPGGITFAGFGPNGKPTIQPLFEAGLPIGEVREDIAEDQERIRKAFHVDLFLLLSTNIDRQKTAFEVSELVAERLTMVGPAMQSLDTDWLRPAVEFVFQRMLDAGLLPPLPQDLVGQVVDFEFVGPLAQAQRAVGTSSIDRALGVTATLGQMRPEVLDNLDADEALRTYYSALGVPTKVMVDPRQRDALREARNRAMAAKEQAAMVAEQAKAVRDLGAAPTGERNALTDLMGAVSGY